MSREGNRARFPFCTRKKALRRCGVVPSLLLRCSISISPGNRFAIVPQYYVTLPQAHSTITLSVTFRRLYYFPTARVGGERSTMISSADVKVCPCGCGITIDRSNRKTFINNAHKQAWYRITKWAKRRARKWVDSLCNGDISYYPEAYYYYVRKAIERRQDRLFGDTIPSS